MEIIKSLKFIADYLKSKDFVLDLVPNFVVGVLIFLLAFYWKHVTFYFKRELRNFRKLFGKETIKDNHLFITVETYRFNRSVTDEPMPFYKEFPGTHRVQFTGPDEDIQRYCVSRAVAHLIDGFRDVRGVSIKLISDVESKPKWEATFINIGTSATNTKSDDIKHLPQNEWLADDLNGYSFKDGTEERFENRNDKGIILKISNPHSPGHTLVVCSGQKEWGTSGAAWFLAKHWKSLRYRFGSNPFLLVINVSIGSDESAREIRFYGEESQPWRIYRFIRFNWFNRNT